MSHDLYVRAFAQPLGKGKPKETLIQRNEPKWPDCALVFDCESRITADQTLTFGLWRFCELRGNEYVPTEEGIFYDEHGLSPNEFEILREYARTTKPNTTTDGCDKLRRYSREKFVHEVFGMAIQAKALIICFNAGFDLSRLALDWETAENGGWSLILSQWRNPKTGVLDANQFFPRVVLRALNSKTSIIHSTRAPISKRGKKSKCAKLWPSAKFLDLRTLLWALRNKSYSLKSACKEFGIPGKLDHKPSGRVDLEEIEYCRQDVRATVGLPKSCKAGI